MPPAPSHLKVYRSGPSDEGSGFLAEEDLARSPTTSDHIEPGSACGCDLAVYADGCFEPDSGTGGWAFTVYRHGEEIASDFGHGPPASNNAMELLALLKAASWINANLPGEPAVIWSDSVYAVTGCNRWRPVWKSRNWRKNAADPKARSRVIPDRALWIAVDAALSANAQLEVRWCKGHAGIPGNEKSDRLAERGRLSGGAQGR